MDDMLTHVPVEDAKNPPCLSPFLLSHLLVCCLLLGKVPLASRLTWDRVMKREGCDGV